MHKVPFDDREDFHHDLLVEMVKVKAKYEVKGKPLTEASLMRVARYEELGYWRKRRYRLFGFDCHNCTIELRHECRMTILPSECPKGKASRLLSLDKPVESNNGDKLTKLNELIADSKARDPTPRLDARLDARRILQILPKRLVKIGYKLYAGIPLEKKEEEYLKRWRKAHPSRKVHPARFDLRRNHLDERILELLRKNPQGMTRSDLSRCLQGYVREVNRYLDQLIKKQQIIAVRRENSRGRPITSLLFIAGAPIPEVRMVKKERDELIRQAYYEEGWSPRRIEREFHHSRKTVRGAIGVKIKVRMDKKERDERIRQVYFIDEWSIKRINRELHHDKRTIRRAIQKGRAASVVLVLR